MDRLHYQTIIASIVLYLVPCFGFLNSKNLPQISIIELWHFAIFLCALFVAITGLIFLTFYLTKILRFKKNEIFLSAFISFYTLFLIKPVFDFIYNLNFLNDNVLVLTLIILIIYNLTMLIVIFKNYKFFIFIRRFFIIFSLFLILNSLLSLFKGDIDFTKKTESQKKQSVALNQKAYYHNSNIYFIIMDEMISFDLAEHMDILIKDEEIRKFKKFNLNYVSNSISSYSGTHYTITSILKIDKIFNKDEKIKTGGLYPALLNQKTMSIPLVDFLNEKGYEFYFVGNYAHTCNEFPEQKWKCISKSNYRNFLKLSKVIYYYFSFNLLEIFDYRSLLKNIFYNYDIFYEGGQRNLKYFLKEIEDNKELINKNNNFFMIHQLSPHTPFTVDENCNEVSYKKFGGKIYEEVYEGYKASYQCVLKEIKQFMNYINLNDPDSIVVIQGDHGTYISDRPELTFDRGLFRAKIFNAIYSPKKCENQIYSSNTSINSIRFVLNCAFNSNFEYLNKTHSIVTDNGIEEKNY